MAVARKAITDVAEVTSMDDAAWLYVHATREYVSRSAGCAFHVSGCAEAIQRSRTTKMSSAPMASTTNTAVALSAEK